MAPVTIEMQYCNCGQGHRVTLFVEVGGWGGGGGVGGLHICPAENFSLAKVQNVRTWPSVPLTLQLFSRQVVPT